MAAKILIGVVSILAAKFIYEKISEEKVESTLKTKNIPILLRSDYISRLLAKLGRQPLSIGSRNYRFISMLP